VPGEFNIEQLMKDHKALFVSAQTRQRKWFMELIRIADILWSRSNGNPLSISDDARMGCKEMNISQKPWLGDIQAAELIRCVACGSLRNGNFPICQTCKAIVDPELAKKLNLTFAQ
jgi:DNA-directed RNA polymerase subunit RPC12/RpoP